MASPRTRLCICYILTTILISLFIFALISNSVENKRLVERMREELDEIAHLVLHNAAGGSGESKQLNVIIENVVKKRLASVWDDLYTLKKQMKAVECIGMKRQTDAVGEKLTDRINYASEELGARVEDVIAEPVCGWNAIKSFLGMEFQSNPPVNMLRSGMEPGSCFAFKNNKSEVTVKLAREIIVEGVEVEHIGRAQAPLSDITSAPRAFTFYGVDTKSCEGEKLLGKFQYDNYGTSRSQLFTIKSNVKYNMVRFKFESNYGHPNYTCVYRVAVYGKMVN